MARFGHLEEGVHCLTCHRIESDHSAPESRVVMAGPLGSDALLQPHAIEVRESWFRDSSFCGRCHEDTFAEWQATSIQQVPTCQECHMPAVRRKVTQSTGVVSDAIVAFEPELELRAHTFDAKSAAVESRHLLADGFLTLTLAPTRSGVRVTLENQLPHALPTGGFGSQAVEVRAFIIDAESSHFKRTVDLDGPGEVQIVFRKILRAKRKEALASGDKLAFEIPQGANDASVLVEVSRLAASGAAEELLARFDITGALSKYRKQPVDEIVRMMRETADRWPRDGE